MSAPIRSQSTPSLAPSVDAPADRSASRAGVPSRNPASKTLLSSERQLAPIDASHCEFTCHASEIEVSHAKVGCATNDATEAMSLVGATFANNCNTNTSLSGLMTMSPSGSLNDHVRGAFTDSSKKSASSANGAFGNGDSRTPPSAAVVGSSITSAKPTATLRAKPWATAASVRESRY